MAELPAGDEVDGTIGAFSSVARASSSSDDDHAPVRARAAARCGARGDARDGGRRAGHSYRAFLPDTVIPADEFRK